MFTGQYKSTINSSGLITLPPQFGAQLNQGAVITRGFDRNLMVLPSQSFRALTENVMSMNLADPITRDLMRLILGNAIEVNVNDAYQFSLPEDLSKQVDLGASTTLVGVGDFFEVWSAGSWSDQQMEIAKSDQDPSRYSSLNLSTRDECDH